MLSPTLVKVVDVLEIWHLPPFAVVLLFLPFLPSSQGRRRPWLDFPMPMGVAAALTAVAISDGLSPSRSPTAGAEDRASALEGVVSEVVVGGQVYAIPAAFIGHQPAHREVLESLSISLPPTSGAEGRLWVSISSPIADGLLERLFQSTTRLSGEIRYEFTGQYYDLHRYLLQGSPRSRRADEVYAWPSAINIQTYIICTNERAPEVSTIVHPSCRHRFMDRGLLIRLTYGREQLPQWRSIEGEIRHLLDQGHRGPSAP